MNAPFRDPAESEGFLRHFYRDWRPTRLARIWNGAHAWASGLGLTPPILLTLQTRDRSGGRIISTVLAPVGHEGRCYLVSMLGGGSQWEQNARAAGWRSVREAWTNAPSDARRNSRGGACTDPEGMVSHSHEWT